MSITLKREILHSNAIALPATKSAGVLSYSSEVFKDFKSSGLAAVDLRLSAADASKVTNNLTFQGYASFDDEATWIKTSNAVANYVDILVNSGTAEVVTGVLAAGTTAAADWAGKYFAIFDGATPYFCWFDVDGNDPKPVTGIALYDNATEVPIDVTGGVSVDGIGAIIVTKMDLVLSSIFTIGYTDGTNTLLITSKNKHACRSAWAGNLLATTATVTSFGTTTQGVDVSAVKQIGIAPAFKVVATFDATGALASGHGVNVDVKMKELNTDYRGKVFANVIPSLIDSTTAAAASYPEFIGTTLNTDNHDPIKKAYVAFYSADTSKFENDVSYAIETSDDGSVWRNAIAPITSFDKSTGVYYVVTEVASDATYKLGNHLRVRVYGDATAALTSGHGIQANVVLCY